MVDGVQLYNYWGYNTVSFFAPNTSYSSVVEHNHEGDELKLLISELKANGMEVILVSCLTILPREMRMDRVFRLRALIIIFIIC